MNSRKHSIIDLATDPSIHAILKKYYNTKVDYFSKEKFEEGEIKHLCGISKKFVKQKNCKLFWTYESY